MKDLRLPSGAWSTANRTIRLRGTIVWQKGNSIVLTDETGSIILTNPHHHQMTVGDLIDAECFKLLGDDSMYVEITSAKIIGHGTLIAPEKVDCDAVIAGRCNFTPVTVEGVVTDAFHDEIDKYIHWLALRSHRGQVMVAIPTSTNGTKTATAYLNALVDAEISVTGCCLPIYGGYRQFLRPHIETTGIDSIQILKPAPDNPFTIPAMEISAYMPTDLPLHRVRLEGTVIATWQHDRLLLECNETHRFEVRLEEKSALPSVGQQATISGFADCNAFRMHISRALVRTGIGFTQLAEPPPAISISNLINEARTFNPHYNGHLLQLRGTIRNLSDAFGKERRLHLDSGGHLITVELGPEITLPQNLSIGCNAAITGICMMDAENNTQNGFSRICGITIIPRISSDITPLSYPPWWTPKRFIAIIAILTATLLAILIWNRALKILIERRGRQLFRAQIAQTSSELRVAERTHLAVELHDSLAQNLTGAAMELEAARGLQGNAPAAMLSHLDIATKTISSCREELRNCLWDLRNLALEEHNMTAAIYKTLQPHISKSKLSIRFNVLRSRIPDNVAHALLRIIRELVLNAIRHGKATSIMIAGNIENDMLSFSVKDNGCGFDPDNHPGVLQGHFGLQGIRERIRPLGGTMTIFSASGNGAKVTIRVKIPSAHNGASTKVIL